MPERYGLPVYWNKHNHELQWGEPIDLTKDTPPPGHAMVSMDHRLKSFEIRIPTNYTEAVASPQAEFWQTAMTNQVSKLQAANA
jgi:hypothetical protein